MKLNYFIINLYFLLFLGLVIPIYAQKSSQNKPVKVDLTDETRKQSVVYADGIRAFYSQNYTEAEQAFQKVISQNPKNDAAFYMLHKIFAAKNDFLMATHYLKLAIKIDKKNEWYPIDLAGVYEKLGDYAAAAKIWEEICKVKYQNEHYLMTLANCYINLNKYLEVIKIYDKLELLLAKNDELTEVKKNIWLFMNDVKNAVREFDKMIEAYPYEISYYISAAEIYQSNNMADKALPYYQKAQTIDSHNASLNICLSNYYESIKKTNESFEFLVKAFKSTELEIEEKLPFLRNYLNSAFRSQTPDYLTQAELLAAILTEVHPLEIEGWVALAKLYSIQNHFEVAKPLYEKAIAIDDAQFSIWEDYFLVLSKLGDNQTIAIYSSKMEEYFPTHPNIQFATALALYKESKYEGALSAAKRALSFTFESNFVGEINLLLGDVYLELGNKDEAVKCWKIAQRRGVSTPELQTKIDNNQ